MTCPPVTASLLSLALGEAKALSSRFTWQVDVDGVIEGPYVVDYDRDRVIVAGTLTGDQTFIALLDGIDELLGRRTPGGEVIPLQRRRSS